MTAFFKWLAGNSIAGYTFIVLVASIVIFLIVSYAAALIQGRNISYWPPRIGGGLSAGNFSNDASGDHIAIPALARGDAPQDIIKVRWTSPSPEAGHLLRNAKYSTLILGTSLFRIVHSDLFVYRDWLKRKPERLLGLLFLNPFSPHAIGRERRDVHRSSSDNILDSVRAAYREADKHAQMVPAIYEGPFRYTARAIDIGEDFESEASSISIVTSSHNQGISKGFEIVLPGPRKNAPYTYYQGELIDQWMQALANPAGHGVSLVGYSDELSRPEQMESTVNRVAEGLSARNSVAHLFASEQLHVTLSSLCRTQDTPFYGPLRLGNGVSPEFLPGHFGDFLCDLIKKSSPLLNVGIEFTFARISVDGRGYINLEPERGYDGFVINSLNEFISDIIDQVTQYAIRYPDENWSAMLNDGKEQRFGPKLDRFMPHVTLGMAFSKLQALPLPLRGAQFSFSITDPLVCHVREISIVHYAYRSLLRNVGRFQILPWKMANVNEHAILRNLGIAESRDNG